MLQVNNVLVNGGVIVKTLTFLTRLKKSVGLINIFFKHILKKILHCILQAPNIFKDVLHTVIPRARVHVCV